MRFNDISLSYPIKITTSAQEFIKEQFNKHMLRTMCAQQKNNLKKSEFFLLFLYFFQLTIYLLLDRVINPRNKI